MAEVRNYLKELESKITSELGLKNREVMGGKTETSPYFKFRENIEVHPKGSRYTASVDLNYEGSPMSFISTEQSEVDISEEGKENVCQNILTAIIIMSLKGDEVRGHTPVRVNEYKGSKVIGSALS